MISRPDPRQRFRRVLTLVAVLAGTALALGACGKNPTKPKRTDTGGLYPYLKPISPENVLQNLVTAYNNRDSVETKVCYHYLYDGTSNDPSDPPARHFTQADEVQHVKRLHNDPNIVAVSLDLGQPGTWTRLPGLVTDPPGTVVIPINYFVLSIVDISNASYTQKPATMEFAFNPTVASPGDTTWTVIRWTETAN